MTDLEVLRRVLSCIDPSATGLRLVRRHGRVLLGLPGTAEAAARSLQLYQPQRLTARLMVKVVRLLARVGLQGWVLPRFQLEDEKVSLTPSLSGIEPGTCGVMLGNPDHQVRRAITCFKTSTGWEVAKVAFGTAGWDVIRGEVEALESLPDRTPGSPTSLGVHRGDDISLMRMPYFQGTVLSPGESTDAIALLDSWKSEMPRKPMNEFPEWPAIESALSGFDQGPEILQRLSQRLLRPVIRHGDFARWNLLRLTSGDLMVLDWEWGIASGMPGIDLVHFFAQDARLVDRLPPEAVVRSVEQSLHRADCRNYLAATGWGDDVRSTMLASIAFTVGTKQQANEEILAALLQDRQAVSR